MKSSPPKNIRLPLLMLGLLLLSAPGRSQEAWRAPEAATGRAEKAASVAERHMVAAAHPLAAEAGLKILRRGGSAVDAAIAVQMVLGLVEPQSSGLGGGAFIVSWNAAAKSLTTFDGRETAPAAATPDRFISSDGSLMSFDTAVRSGLSVGVPGVLRALETAHAKFGKLPWAELFAPAISLARTGFPMTTRLNALLRGEGLDRFSAGARAIYFGADGAPLAVGALVHNDAYAQTLETIAKEGVGAFYDGPIAEEIVAAVAAAPFAKGDLTLEDLKAYKAVEREPVCFTYRLRKICGMGPPSSGTLTVAQALKLIEPFSGITGPGASMSPQALHLIAEAEKLAFADRNRYIADPAFVQVPPGLLDSAYIEERRKLIARASTMEKPQPGVPPGLGKRTHGIDTTHEVAGTSHLSIVDGEGNAVSMTTTIESAFGSHLMAAGFLLNNELTDFSMMPAGKDGIAAANRVEGGKRPRSSMTPLIGFAPDGSLEFVTGSPGGSRIILFITKTLVALIDWQMGPQEAAALENFGSDGGPFILESGSSDFWLTETLKTFGHNVSHEAMTSGVHTIMRRAGKLEGGADPRREGVAIGD